MDTELTSSGWNRRRFLQAAGAGAVAFGLAGCSTDQSFTFAAAPIALYGGAEHGFTETDRQELTEERTMSVGDVNASVTMTSQFALYGADRVSERTVDVIGRYTVPILGRYVVGLGTVPTGDVLGQPVNPVARQSVEALLRGETGFGPEVDGTRFGEHGGHMWAKLFGRETARELRDGFWQTGPTEVDSAPATVIGTDATIQTYGGLTATERLVLVGAVKTVTDGDLVLGGVTAEVSPESMLYPDGWSGRPAPEAVSQFTSLAVYLFEQVDWEEP